MTSSSQSTPSDSAQDLIVLDPRLWFLVNMVCCVIAVLEQGVGMFSFPPWIPGSCFLLPLVSSCVKVRAGL